MPRTFYVATAGTMASGKTTVARLIAKYLGFHLLLENFGENRFLPRFYKDMRRWAFHSQTFYLMEKIVQMLQTKKTLKKVSVVQDTVIYQDVLSYARAQYILGNMDDAEFALYSKIYSSFVDRLPKPDLIVYLRAPVEVLKERVKKRQVSVNKNQKLSYLRTLDKLNRKWIYNQQKEKVLFIDAYKNNFVVNSGHVNGLIEGIKKKLYLAGSGRLGGFFTQNKLDTLKKKQVILLSGMPGCGKSTLAKKLSLSLRANLVSSDKIRQKIFKNPHFNPKSDFQPTGFRQKYYALLFEEVKILLIKGKKVIIDASCMDAQRKTLINKIGKLINKKNILVIIVEVPKKIIAGRIKKIKKINAENENYFSAWQRVYGYFERHLKEGTYFWPHLDEGVEILEIKNC